jgi:Flp pilus assembly protein TadD
MGRRLIGHGCLLVLIGGVGSLEVYGADPLPVQARVFDIDYAVSEEALPLDSVQLWYTMDRGEAWHRYGLDEDRQSPISFHAPSEGLFGFFVVLSNATGQSSRPPTRSTQPHFWAFVDYTPPVVQLHPARQTTLLGQRVLQIRWTAIDAHLGSRPVEIACRRPPADAWLPVSTDPLANTGRYDWRLPEDVVGQVAVRVTVRDKGGHAVESEQQVCEITAAGPGDSALVGGDGNAPEVTDAARARAERLFREGLAHRDRGEYRLGVARMREAVRLDPRSAEAFAEMAGMLYRMDDIDRALHAYEIALEQEPTLRSALQGAAMVDRQKKDYTSAAARLRTILRHHPDDAEVWMNLGDIAIFQGDEVMARECYTRAVETDPMATQVIEDARKRLALMAKVSRTYR